MSINKEAYIAQSLGLKTKQVAHTLQLFAEGATLPFICRYRKEMTGGLNEVQLAKIQEENEYLEALEKRKATVLSTIEKSGQLTDALQKRIADCLSATELEDIYLPFKPKRQTRAEAAKQKGLTPLTDLIWEQKETAPEVKAKAFVTQDVPTVADALQGARDIVAERIAEHEAARQTVRKAFEQTAVISAKVVKKKAEEAEKYSAYFDFSEPLRHCASHRLLAIRRGEAEGFLRVRIAPRDEARTLEQLARRFLRARNASSDLMEEALEDAYDRLLLPSIETEFAQISKQKADTEAIRVFTENLKQLLLAAPLGRKRILAIDPGFRTGCKVVCLDEQGMLLHNTTIYPHPPQSERTAAAQELTALTDRYQTEAIAIGNGTAGRETEQFVHTLGLSASLSVFVVSEDGASVYSATKTARDEFPNHDATVRGAVSIGRRLLDPMAELVKIEPRSLGVGQYQHDVDQSQLKRSLEQTVENCVNAVGVQLNTASSHLLTYVSGLGAGLAQNIVDYRTEHGHFASRAALLKVPRLGPKAYEQCAGFLRIAESKHILDNTAVHPERYGLVEQMAKDVGCTVEELVKSKDKRAQIDLKSYLSENVGLPTLEDIMAELDKPGRDPRGKAQAFRFDERLRTLSDVQVGQTYPGIITNITNFGCFVDIGIKEKGLVHVSQMVDNYVSNPADVVRLHQQVDVRVIEVNESQKRIALSMRSV